MRARVFFLQNFVENFHLNPWFYYISWNNAMLRWHIFKADTYKKYLTTLLLQQRMTMMMMMMMSKKEYQKRNSTSQQDIIKRRL